MSGGSKWSMDSSGEGSQNKERPLTRPFGCLRGARSRSALGHSHELGKGFGIAHGEIREDLAVEIHGGLLQTAHELGVAGAVLRAGGVDAHHPEATEVALLDLAVAVGVAEGLLDGFLGGAVQAGLGAVEALGELHHAFAALGALEATFYASHVASFPRGSASGNRRALKASSGVASATGLNLRL